MFQLTVQYGLSKKAPEVFAVLGAYLSSRIESLSRVFKARVGNPLDFCSKFVSVSLLYVTARVFPQGCRGRRLRPGRQGHAGRAPPGGDRQVEGPARPLQGPRALRRREGLGQEARQRPGAQDKLQARSGEPGLQDVVAG